MEIPFLFDADQLALDFLNTRRRSEGVEADVLSTPNAPVTWLREAGTLSGDEARHLLGSPPEMRRLLEEALRLRDAILEGVVAWTRGVLVPDPPLLVLNRALAARATGSRIDRDGSALRLVETVRNDRVLGALAPVALAAAALLASANPGRVRRCHADDCALWFLDTSRNGSRRWCSMARCGNRAKVAAHYRRTHGS